MMIRPAASDGSAAAAAPARRPHLTLIHGSAAGAGQWDALRAQLPSTWAVDCVALAGYDGDALPAEAAYGIETELRRVAAPPVHTSPRVLVGHSMGGLVAAAACLAAPARYDALVLVEPVLFGLLARPGFTAVQHDVRSFLRYFASLQDPVRQLDAARAMFHFWKQYDAWEALSPARRERVAACMEKVRLECRLFDDAVVQADRLLRLAEVRVTWVTGSESPLHIHRVRQSFSELLPHTEFIEIAGAGHLGHVTHPRDLAAALANLVHRIETAQTAWA
jgi:lipase